MTLQGQITPGTCFGALTLNGVYMHTYAWDIIDLTELFLPPQTRGGNVVVPGAQGRRPYPLRADETRYSLPMVISGVTDEAGIPYADPYIGLQTNLTALTAVFQNDPTSPGFTANLDTPDGTILSAFVQVASVKLGNRMGPIIRATLDLVIPAGGFA